MSASVPLDQAALWCALCPPARSRQKNCTQKVNDLVVQKAGIGSEWIGQGICDHHYAQFTAGSHRKERAVAKSRRLGAHKDDEQDAAPMEVDSVPNTEAAAAAGADIPIAADATVDAAAAAASAKKQTRVAGMAYTMYVD